MSDPSDLCQPLSGHEPRVLDRRVVHRDPTAPNLTVRAKDLALPDGRTVTLHSVDVMDGQPGAVCLAVHRDAVLMVRQWRATLEAWTWELPRGMGTIGEDAITTATRELLEETGIRTDSGQLLHTFFADTGLLANPIHLVLIPVADAVPSEPTDGEVESSAWVPVDALDRMVADGEVVDGITLAAHAL